MLELYVTNNIMYVWAALACNFKQIMMVLFQIVTQMDIWLQHWGLVTNKVKWSHIVLLVGFTRLKLDAGLMVLPVVD